MPASGAAAEAALEKMDRSEYQVRSFEVIIFGLKRGRRGGRIVVHASIFS
jgi:hypothetical protein